MESEVKIELERPIIDIEFNSEEIISDSEFQSPSRIRRWLSIKSIVEKLSRMNFEIRSFSQFILDKIIINRISPKYVDFYIKKSPYILQGITLLPVFFIYNKINDEVFNELHFMLSPLRILYLWKYPVRLGFSCLMGFSSLYIMSFMQYPKYTYKMLSRHSPKWFFLWFKHKGLYHITRKLLVCLALCSEVFGEAIPNDRLLAYKPPVAKMSLCNKTFVNHVLSQKYDTKKLPLLDLMLDQDKDLIIELEIIPDGIGEKSLEQKVVRIKNSQRRKNLRIRSKFHAKKLRNSIKRIALF